MVYEAFERIRHSLRTVLFYYFEESVQNKIYTNSKIDNFSNNWYNINVIITKNTKEKRTMRKIFYRTIALVLACLTLLPFVAVTTSTKADAVYIYYDDVHPSKWYYVDVYYVKDNHLMNGYSDHLFGPEDLASRAMIATILWRLDGSPAPATASTFSDIPSDTWYSDPVAWMQEVGLTNGSGNNKFLPNDNVTREELATFFYRYAEYKGYLEYDPIMNDLAAFKDTANISFWAKDAMSWAVGEHIVNGVGNEKLAPQKTAQRCEIAAILKRFHSTDFTRKRLVYIEAGGDPEKLIMPLGCQSAIFWEHLVVTGYYSDGSVEPVPRQNKDGYSWSISWNAKDAMKLGPMEVTIWAHYCYTTAIITVVDALPYTPIDVEAAMEVANAHAASLGFTIDYTLVPDNSQYYPPEDLSVVYLDKYGGQECLIDAACEKMDTLYDRAIRWLPDEGKTADDIHYVHARCYIVFHPETNGYWIYGLYN